MAQIAFSFVHLSAYQKDLRCWQCSINPDFDSNRPKMRLESSALSCRQEELHQHDLWDFLLCEIFPIFRTLATWVRLSNRAEECSMPGKKNILLSFFLPSSYPSTYIPCLLTYRLASIIPFLRSFHFMPLLRDLCMSDGQNSIMDRWAVGVVVVSMVVQVQCQSSIFTVAKGKYASRYFACWRLLFALIPPNQKIEI